MYAILIRALIFYEHTKQFFQDSRKDCCIIPSVSHLCISNESSFTGRCNDVTLKGIIRHPDSLIYPDTHTHTRAYIMQKTRYLPVIFAIYTVLQRLWWLQERVNQYFFLLLHSLTVNNFSFHSGNFSFLFKSINKPKCNDFFFLIK